MERSRGLHSHLDVASRQASAGRGARPRPSASHNRRRNSGAAYCRRSTRRRDLALQSEVGPCPIQTKATSQLKTMGGKNMIYELRIYQCIPGKLPALLKRFESKTLDIWKKHGIRPTGFWTVLLGDGNNDLHYLLGWESLAEREQKWNAFQADPEWHKARDESEKDGLIIANIRTTILRPTAFSAIR